MLFWVVVWQSLIHLAGIYLFTRGFLLTRLSLSNHSDAPQQPLPATHERAVVLIIDSLRFDFISPNPPEPPSPFHHNVLNTPRELTEKYPDRSFIFNSYADPPTATLQRIKGITTGSLPTFVDIGSNFGASYIEEDSIIKQVNLAGKKAAFMGDDTWMSVFPDAFVTNLTFPYDSFNVEDLHTVDNGVTTHLLPLLSTLKQNDTSTKPPFDFLVAHCLGVDHVGHRVSPHHPSMRSKLQQMDELLSRVVDLLDDDTLLVVMGDHGMDNAGDHGGDGVPETSAALWIYSKSHSLSAPPSQRSDIGSLPESFLEHTTYPGTTVPHRRVQQIDLVPTLSLLLGLPIPYNNLGTVIPELFWRPFGSDSHEGKAAGVGSWIKKVARGSSDAAPSTVLERAFSLNSQQIKTYLDTYRSSSSGRELDGYWDSLEYAWTTLQTSSDTNVVQDSKSKTALEAFLESHYSYNRAALNSCRAIWAQFSQSRMLLGLVVIAVGAVAGAGVIWVRLRGVVAAAEQGLPVKEGIKKLKQGALFGAVGGAAAGFATRASITAVQKAGINVGGDLNWLDLTLFGGAVGSSIVAALSASASSSTSSPASSSKTLSASLSMKFLQVIVKTANNLPYLTPLIIPLLHTLSFLSNSFTFWEDRIVPFLFTTAVLPWVALTTLRAPNLQLPSSGTSPSGEGSAPMSTTKRLKLRIIGFSLLSLVMVRAMSYSSVCREEQGGMCAVTYYASATPAVATADANATTLAPTTSTSSSPPLFAVLLAPVLSIALPSVIIPKGFLSITRSGGGIGRFILPFVLAPVLLAGSMGWIGEWIEIRGSGADGGVAMGGIASLLEMLAESGWIRTLRTWVSWLGVVSLFVIGAIAWYLIPICLEVENEDSQNENKNTARTSGATRKLNIIGFANAYGSPYLLFWGLLFGLVYMATQLTGQVTLALAAVAILAYAEVLDSVRDIRVLEQSFDDAVLAAALSGPSTVITSPNNQGLQASRPTPTLIRFAELIPLALLALHAFFTTGHQATISSIQWKSAFILTKTVVYPWAPLTVVLNSVGPMFIAGLGVPLLVLWNKAPELQVPVVPPAPNGQAKTQQNGTQSETSQVDPDTLLEAECVLAGLGYMAYFTLLLFGSSLSAAILRRHLMVWKVFAPRFMFGVLGVLTADLAVVVGVGMGTRRIIHRMAKFVQPLRKRAEAGGRSG